jgi:hypothetical protein
MAISVTVTLNEQQMRQFYLSLNEKDRRHYAAVEASKFGHGGIHRICEILGCDPKTVRRGIEELNNPPDIAPDRVRKKGGTSVLS